MQIRYSPDWTKLWELAIGLGTVFFVLLTPLFDNIILRSLRRNTERFDRLRLESLLRDRANTKQHIVEIFKNEFDEWDRNALSTKEALVLINGLYNTVETIQTSLLQQGSVLQEHIRQVFTPLTQTLESISANLTSLAVTTNDNARSIARIEGAMSEWDGTERRHTPNRRKPSA